MHARLPGTRPEGTRDESGASREVRRMFSGIAARYDLLNHLLSLRFDVIWRKRLADRMAPILARADARILDLCCGTGDLALELADAVAELLPANAAAIVAADFAHPMLVLAQEKATANRGRPVEFVEADALSLPFADGTFDLAATAFGFRNLVNYAAGLEELRRVLRPGGTAAILEFAEPENAIFRKIFHFYFHRILPSIGAMISGDAQAYSYLPQSVARFPTPRQLAQLMQESGFGAVNFEAWTGGIVTLHTGQALPQMKARDLPAPR